MEAKPIPPLARRAVDDSFDVCRRLSESSVADRPPLEDVLGFATENEPFELELVDITEETARDLVATLPRHYRRNGDEERGRYRYPDGWTFLSVTQRGTSTAGLDGGDHQH